MAELQLEKLFRAFANSSRIKILQLLKKEKNISVAEIAEKTKFSYKATSKHLAILYSADIVDRKQVTYEVHYFISNTLDHKIKTILNLL